ncbi:nicolin 1 [Nesidiocoris tenuis]|uniref:Nicolin 1 n=2 Tax=Nesidiocoris tenuis TaxID=355587 RepID=A0ABN7AC27_9HEMI|nr:nicolin 1 [Nesidiocoris tenuis]
MTSATEERYCRENVEFTVKGPIPLFLEEEKKHLSGCAVIDIILSKPERVGELVFRNYYVASIDLLVQVEKEGQQPQQPGRVRQPVNWQVSLQKKILMPKPHEEEGSHGVFSITSTESLVQWDRVSMMRIILRQPSPLWASFKLEELNLFADLPRLGETGAPPLVVGSQKVLGIVQKQTTKALMTVCQGDGPRISLSATTPTEAGKYHDYRNQGQVAYEIVKLPTS